MAYRKIIVSLLLSFCLPLAASLPPPAMMDRPKIGLVLSGGGAKGFAHVGVLKMLDSLEIPVDYIAGTSMGGIVGALYAIGYSGKELEVLARSTDWQEIFTDRPHRDLLPYFEKMQSGRYQLEFGFEDWRLKVPSGLVFGQKISLLFSSLTFPFEQAAHFDELPIPFRCVAVDLKTGNEVVLEKGSLAKAMRSTMAIPTAFSPIAYGDSLLVDGGILNNLPVDVVQEMGADIVIAVDVANIEANDSDLDNILDVLDRFINLQGISKWKENRKRADIFIAPDLNDYTLADFLDSKIRGILRQGDAAAAESQDELLHLKQRFALERVADPADLVSYHDSLRIHGVQITGQKSLDFQQLYEMLACEPNALFQPRQIEKTMTDMRVSGMVEKISYETIPVSDEFVRLVFHVRERKTPQIQGIRVYGNRILPFGFIYRLIGIQPGDRLNTDVLNQRIMQLYGLGYFESIRYSLEPVQSGRVRLKLHVKEKPLRRWRVGVHYDNYRRVVASVQGQANNIPVAGMRLESDLQFMGLVQFRHRGYYPSRSLAFPVYPFYELGYKDIPTSIFGSKGKRIAEYNDESFYVSAGLGLILQKSFSLELAYTYEDVFTTPRIAFPDPNLFPEFNDLLRRIDLNLRIDRLDNVFVPRRGLLLEAGYEGSFKALSSETAYQHIYLSVDFYRTLSRNHTFRMAGFFTDASHKTPFYKYSNQGYPHRFAGLDYDQLIGYDFSFLRLDYRYQWNDFLFFKVMANRTLRFVYQKMNGKEGHNNVWGLGAGLMVATPLGPFELTLSRGSQCVQSGGVQNRYDVSFGVKL